MGKKGSADEKLNRIRQLIDILNNASRAYYQESREIMTNYEYDALYDELIRLEEETGVVLANSPTANVGYEVLSDLPKESHPQRMLSLDKTKDPDQLTAWLGEQEGVLSWKLDGLTIVLTYKDGKFNKAVTRGNGQVGEVVTNNARTFINLPLAIDFKGELIIRGEAVISYDDFELINKSITDESTKYKNPRNLCSGSVRQLNNEVTAKRRVRFYAFSMVSAEGKTFETRSSQFEWLEKIGFEVVEHSLVTSETIREELNLFEKKIENNPIPSDGLVLSYDDIEYGKSLGVTSKFPRDSIAFKWKDELRDTVLKEIEWSASRTGLINPIAIFEPVELEGTTVSRASVHNVSVMKELKLGIGDRISVYKANMIIPQIRENFTKSDNIKIPKFCPVCGSQTQIDRERDVETLICPNSECQAKQIKSFTLFVSRDAMNIEGLSEMTLEKLIAKGLIKEPADIFRVENFRDEFINMEGLGEKSFENLKKSVERAKNTTPERLLYSLGISGIGKANAKLIARHCHNKWEAIQGMTYDELVKIDGIGDVMADSFCSYFSKEKNKKNILDLLNEVNLDESEEIRYSTLDDITFVITGSLNNFENRDALKAEIEKAGGKVSGSVSSKTNYLINNDMSSNSSKNKKAKELGIPIINEDMIVEWLKNGI
ncbi:MAG: NAD-dependent DNA ligase LigA [Firmicutes bacterium]|jgi:DNA ligase (NAD+)|nr:NAD-dependent DNA ligase LigA [Bacillota bacterium]